MKQQSHSEKMKKELDIMMSKINALEVVSKDEFQKGVVKVLRTLVDAQMHSLNEFDHLKKAIDLLTLQFFDVQRKVNS